MSEILEPPTSFFSATSKFNDLLIKVTEEDFDDDTKFSAALWWFKTAKASAKFSKRYHGGSVKGENSNKPRDWEGVHMRYVLRYVWSDENVRPGTTQNIPSDIDNELQRSFRIMGGLFMELYAGSVQNSRLLMKGLMGDAPGNMGIPSLLKDIVALQRIFHSMCVEICD